MSWLFAMPLLSTLAALVIIVHSAEEMERERGWSSREASAILDREIRDTDYEQPWRAIDSEPILQPTTTPDAWVSSENAPKRRRFSRKRKRRPQMQERNVGQDKYLYQGEQRRPDIDYRDTNQALRRRRLPSLSRDEETDVAWPKRGIQNRRPSESYDTWVEPEDFEQDRSNERLPEMKPVSAEDRFLEGYNRYVHRKYNSDTEPKLRPLLDGKLSESKVRTLKNPPNKDKSLSDFSSETLKLSEPKVWTLKTPPNEDKFQTDLSSEMKRLSEPKAWIVKNVPNKDKSQTDLSSETKRLSEPKAWILKNVPTQDKSQTDFSSETKKLSEPKPWTLKNPPNKDKSLSDFSSEIKDHNLSPRFSTGGKEKKGQTNKAAVTTTAASTDKIQPKSTSPTHAVTIKEILKRSKGKSLSEILEQHKLSLTDLLQGKINPLSILKTIGETSSTKLSSVSSSDEGSKQKNEKTEESSSKPEVAVTDSLETGSSPWPKKTYKKAQPVENDLHDSQKIEVYYETTTEENYEKPRNNGTFIHPALLKQKKRLKQRIQLTTKPPTRQSDPKTNNKPNSLKTSKMSEWREVLPRILTIHPASPSEYKDDINEDKDFNKESTDDSTEIPPRFLSTTDANEEESIDLTTSQVYIAPRNTPDYGEWVDVDNVKLVSEVPETTTDQELTTETETVVPSSTTTTTTTTTTEGPRIFPFRRPTANSTAMRQQVFTNRMKKKRLQVKTSSTPAPEPAYTDSNLQAAAEFIEKVPSTTTSRKPTQTTQSENEIDIEWTTDPMDVSESSERERGEKRTHRRSTAKPTTTSSTTETTARNEIDEILNDTRTSAKLSRILFERNMTLGELVEHRERGSSQVHLADIFHNSSKEPSPAEPFLSKSLIEPMSKETYPLRAILENQHDSTMRPFTVQDYSSQTPFYNIPVVMDFGNNVNENGENMGIMSLFNNYTKNDLGDEIIEGTYTNSDSEGSPYISSVAVIAANDSRNGRNMKDSWNDLFAIIKGRRQQNLSMADTRKEEEEVTSSSYKDNSASDSYKKTSIEDDADGDGLIILEDLQRYAPKTTATSKAANHLDSNVFHDDSHDVMEVGVINKSTSTTRSVTVATASIIGLAMVLFLLTYALLKWNQQRHIMRDKSRFGNERIATPVFENHNELAHNNSCRSINSMMSSNIYTGFDSKNGKESPVYMWDDLKKPFQ